MGLTGCWRAMGCEPCSPQLCLLPAQPRWEWGEVDLELIPMAEKLLGAFPTLIFSKEKKAFKMPATNLFGLMHLHCV